MINHIAFPGLSLGPFAISESFSFFGLTIHWYAIFIVLGILLAYLFCSKIAKEYDLKTDNLLDIIIYGLPSAIICARLYYVFILDFDAYKNNLGDIFKIWEGGLSIHGGTIGACLSTYFYCRFKKIAVGKVFDIGAFGLLIGQMIGRFGNFVNAEVYGVSTNLPWRMELLDLGICVHPLFLYESLWNFGALLLLFFRRKKNAFHGETFLSYLTLYGLGRFWMEGLRFSDYQFRVSQVVAILYVIFGIGLIFYNRFKNKTKA